MGFPTGIISIFFLLIKTKIEITLVCGIHARALGWKALEVLRVRRTKAERG